MRGSLHDLTTNLMHLLSCCTTEREFADRAIESLTAIIGVRYGAIALLDDAGEVREFAHCGLPPRFEERIGRLPTQGGLLASVLRHERTFHCEDVSRDPRSRGFPPGHPQIRSLLAVALVEGDRIAGRVYLGEKRAGRRFTRDDERIVQGFADAFVLALGCYRLERERHTLEKRLHQAEKMKAIGRLASGVAHDFNNLLTVMAGYTGVLARTRMEDPRSARAVRELSRAVARASALTRQLLTFCRRQPSQPRVLDPGEVVAGMRPLLEKLLGDAIPLRLDLDPGAGRVRLDPIHLEQVIMNLVANARDASSPGQTVRVSLRGETQERLPGPAGAFGPTRPWVVLEVADEGCGMAPEVRDRVFEPFFTTKGGSTGTGLGLSTVHGIVRQSGGWVDIESHPGRGTRVEVRLPRRDETVAPRDEATSPEVPRGAESILVLEDEDHVAEVASEMLRELGYRVEVCGSGDAALARAGEGVRWDLLLADVSMPGRSGPEVAAELVTRGAVSRVTFVSGNPLETVESLGSVMDDGPLMEALRDYLPKPFTEAELARRVRDVLDAPAVGPAAPAAPRTSGLPEAPASRPRPGSTEGGEPALHEAEPPAGGCKPGPTGRVLVVDDDEQVRSFVRGILGEAGLEVEEAPEGAAGLRRLREQHFDAVLTDLVMPETEGLELCQIVRREHPGTRILAMSGHPAGLPLLGAARRFGAARILRKPFTRREVEAAVRELLEDRSGRPPGPAPGAAGRGPVSALGT